MLPSQVGAIDRNRPGNRDIASREEEIPVTHSHLRRVLSLWLVSVLMCVVIAAPQVSGQSKGRKRKAGTSATAGGSPGEQSLTNIPLPIGHEAKGLVLPDFDGDGRLRGKFEAGTAHRIDQEHVGFQHLKITTYTPQSQPDLQIDMLTSVLDLKTKILSSQERTTIQRSDFNIAGDSVQFDTNSKTGRLSGNVKMVITDKSHLTAKPNTTE
ncbi:MAG: hypothetical protein DMF36_04470 [Verrucomicrobia bacterium]|jgi:hypothetical protein|nr:MAG: hypothetical protein DME64_03875 [Verrucomicrobiota bacterium]PYL39819.1 MAG: hypothetical protein DMF36_04470 [Verrucomicrobiota bacterium]